MEGTERKGLGKKWEGKREPHSLYSEREKGREERERERTEREEGDVLIVDGKIISLWSKTYKHKNGV